ncbi:unnamed protein product [Acanthosepion pharaonis]|uniref:Uncharacterized protein n=1 Tax=Acanthosepion pharaonis TaxID=158019 RepID=A0A812E9E1_ACAPH|nr:unnamed protein product [Sepia pharaonis]
MCNGKTSYKIKKKIADVFHSLTLSRSSLSLLLPPLLPSTPFLSLLYFFLFDHTHLSLLSPLLHILLSLYLLRILSPFSHSPMSPFLLTFFLTPVSFFFFFHPHSPLFSISFFSSPRQRHVCFLPIRLLSRNVSHSFPSLFFLRIIKKSLSLSLSLTHSMSHSIFPSFSFTLLPSLSA